MASIVLSEQEAAASSEADVSIGTPLYGSGNTSTEPVELTLNRAFQFPMRSPDSLASMEGKGSNSQNTSQQPTLGARRNQRRSASTLPSFSFNPSGASVAALNPTTPPHSPNPTTPTTPSRAMGHRRGGSEFIGGDGRTGTGSILSTSPTKGDGILPPPTSELKLGPPAGRRGHAHRRSGAISSHDLSSILQPRDANAVARAGSAPATPLEDHSQQYFHSHTASRSMSQPSLRTAAEGADPLPRRPPSRARVGFSEKVEIIRPLSTISSETESSISTVRGHSVSNSLSSVISLGASSPPSSRVPRQPAGASFGGENSTRPSTAGAIFDRQALESYMFKGEPTSTKRPMSAILSPSSDSSTSASSPNTPRFPPKKKGFFWQEADKSGSNEISLPISKSEPSFSSRCPTESPSENLSVGSDGTKVKKTHSPIRKNTRKQRKVKTWANSIISRKPKKQARRAPTPPLPKGQSPPSTASSDDDELEAGEEYHINSTISVMETQPETQEQRIKLDTSVPLPKSRAYSVPDSDSMSPLIDLDAALGPFHTSASTPAVRALHSGGFAIVRRPMHSSTMMLHRRAESAPELAPFDMENDGPPPLLDVFEEEDEEEVEEKPKARSMSHSVNLTPSPLSAKSTGIQVVESDDEKIRAGAPLSWSFDDGLGIRTTPRPSTAPNERVLDEHGSNSTVTSNMSAEVEKQQPPALNLGAPLVQNVMTPDTFNTSSFSSPDFSTRGQNSFDTPRLGTASSSVTDRQTLNSLAFGQPGPNMRKSVDDVPSLTSSRSTVPSGMHGGYPMAAPRLHDERNASVSSIPSVASERPPKRSSIASLSRLVGGSFGERSKLNIEQRPLSEHLETPKNIKSKKGKRLSKLMHFFRPKDTN
ncbi:hypothetical protein M501DRAFT_936237 [Patellaria atrata CBS 101060]|uniref:Cell wall proline rich protein n=1 Tax=Patellaria atrata CBS 101060 TaxID=1346257 RepID=A0A9P4VP45_9PEZI|nr:hypothetical protein M501DRAFT_936237 [Patellaria atrata CBS 101060]